MYYVFARKIICFFRKHDFSEKVNYLLRNMICSFENMTFAKKINYLLRNKNLFENTTFPRTVLICFGNMTCSFKKMPKRHQNGMS